MRIPFNDLAGHHAPLKEEMLRAISAVIDSGEFAGGRYVEAFEEDFSAYCGTSYAIGVGTGTDALWLTLKAMGIGPGDEVITVPMSFIATAEAISFTGARPVFVDIDPVTYTMDSASLEGALTSRTKAVIPVHLFGQPADMKPIMRFAGKHGLRVIEDAAQSHGAEYCGQKAGSIGDAGCFSFYPGKNLGALGEGGAVVTNDEVLAEKIRILRDHGQARKYHHSVVGWNSRMDGIQGAVLSVKLRHLDASNQIRRNLASQYIKLLADVHGLVLPQVGENRKHVYHVFAVQVPDRNRVANSLTRRGIGHGIHYPVPIHLQPAFHHLDLPSGSFPISERCSERFISLPIFPELTLSEIEVVAEAFKVEFAMPLHASFA